VWENAIESYSEHLTEEMQKSWDDFCEKLRHENRFFPESSFNFKILAELLKVLSSKTEEQLLFRARFSTEKMPSSEMGKPKPIDATIGRMNPRGISYLYLSEDPNTALAEIRAIAHDSVSLGKFRIQESKKILDLTKQSIGSPFEYGSRFRRIMEYSGFLFWFATELSKPVNYSKADLDYIPIQYICEFIKKQGFHGIRFKSSVTDGINLTLFDNTGCECIDVEYIQVHKVYPVKLEWSNIKSDSNETKWNEL